MKTIFCDNEEENLQRKACYDVTLCDFNPWIAKQK